MHFSKKKHPDELIRLGRRMENKKKGKKREKYSFEPDSNQRPKDDQL